MRGLLHDTVINREAYDTGHAHACLCKYAGDAVKTDALSGRLYFSQSGWLLLSVPNALGRGAFDALAEAGAELPNGSDYNAHISVMNPDDVTAIGGPDKISERGHQFHYSLGPVKEVVPTHQTDISKVWYIQVSSPELRELRKSYGLPAQPHDGEFDFHVTFGQRRKNVLRNNPVSKAAADLLGLLGTEKAAIAEPADREDCPHCGAMMERGENGICNRCGKDWPAKTAGFQGGGMYSPEGIDLPLPAAALAGTTLTGSMIGSTGKAPVSGAVRGGLKGLGTGVGGLAGLAAAEHLGIHPLLSALLGGGLGFGGTVLALRAAGLVPPPPPPRPTGDLLSPLDELAKEGAVSNPVLQQLMLAKAESDRRNWVRKHAILRKLISGDPNNFTIDSDDGAGMLGITHGPTKFKIHMPSSALPVPIANGALKTAAEELLQLTSF